MRVLFVVGLSLGWMLRSHQDGRHAERDAVGMPAAFNQVVQVVEKPNESSRGLLLDIIGQERSHATTAVAGLNAFAAALLGFEAVLGVVGIGLKSLPNLKGAALASLAASMVIALLSLMDFVVSGRECHSKPPGRIKKFIPRRPWAMGPEGLAKLLEEPLSKSEKIAFTAAARVYVHTLEYVIKPKKRCLTLAVAFLILTLVLGGIGVDGKY